MRLEHALQQLRDVKVEPPSFADVEQRRRWKAERALPKGRLGVALVATLAAIAGFLVLSIRPLADHAYSNAGHVDDWFRISMGTIVPACLLAWGFRCARRPGVGPQMLARAIWWSNLLVGMLIAGNFLARVDQFVGAGIAIACAVPLLVLGQRGLDAAPSDPFQPMRFRGHLLLSLVMAFADAQTLLFSAVMQLRVGMMGWNLLGTIFYAGPAMLAALVMALAVWGLYRLRTWALLLNLVGNFVIAYLAMEGTLNVAPPIAIALFGTAACQALLPVPILAIAIGDRKAGRPWLLGHAPKLLPVSVVLIAGAAIVQAVFVTNPDGWLTGPGQAFRRGMLLENAGFFDAHTNPMRGLPVGATRKASLRAKDLRRVVGAQSWDHRDLTGANLVGARIPGSSIKAARLAGADLSGGHFEDSSFFGSDLRRTKIVGASLAFADLRFTGLEGASLERSDLTGAFMTAMTTEQAARVRWSGATCPDGTPADPDRGCIGREAHVPREEAASYGGDFLLERGWGDRCTLAREISPIVVEHLGFGGVDWIRSARDHFTTTDATLRFDRRGGRVRIILEDEVCGRRVFLRVE